MTNRVYIFDTTLRDGEQSPGCSMTVEEKLRLARKLVELGVDTIEAGFPIASEGDFEAVRAVSDEVSDVEVAALARACALDVERAARALECAPVRPVTPSGSPYQYLPGNQISQIYSFIRCDNVV